MDEGELAAFVVNSINLPNLGASITTSSGSTRSFTSTASRFMPVWPWRTA